MGVGCDDNGSHIHQMWWGEYQRYYAHLRAFLANEGDQHHTSNGSACAHNASCTYTSGGTWLSDLNTECANKDASIASSATLSQTFASTALFTAFAPRPTTAFAPMPPTSMMPNGASIFTATAFTPRPPFV